MSSRWDMTHRPGRTLFTAGMAQSDVGRVISYQGPRGPGIIFEPDPLLGPTVQPTPGRWDMTHRPGQTLFTAGMAQDDIGRLWSYQGPVLGPGLIEEEEEPPEPPEPPPWAPPLIAGVEPSVFADFALDHYYAGGFVQPDITGFMLAAGGTYTNSTGKYVTNAQGLLQQLPANAIPFNYRWTGSAAVPAGVLLEGASSNQVSNSNLFNAAWIGGSAVQNVVGPDGIANSGWTITAAGGFPYITYNNCTVSSPMTLSIYMKASNVQYGTIANQGVTASNAYYDLQNGVVAFVPSGQTAAMVPLANGWYRCSLTIPTAGQNFIVIGAAGTVGTNPVAGDSLFVFGAQCEALPFASSYIPSTIIGPPRSADAFTLAPPGGFDTTAETLYGNVTDYGVITTASGSAPCALSDGTFTNYMDLRLRPDGRGEALLGAGGVNQFDLLTPALLLGGGNKLAASASVPTGGTLVVNAGTAATGAVATMPATLSAMRLGATATGVLPLYGNLAQVGAWPVAATATELQELTS
jgi:hypothetical protein